MKTKEEILKAGVDQEIESEVKALSKAFTDCIDPGTSKRLRAYSRKLVAQNARRRAEEFCFNVVVVCIAVAVLLHFGGPL